MKKKCPPISSKSLPLSKIEESKFAPISPLNYFKGMLICLKICTMQDRLNPPSKLKLELVSKTYY